MQRYTLDDHFRDKDPEGNWVLYEALGDFATHREVLRDHYGDPRVSTLGGLKREYFELEDGKVIMFASPTQMGGLSPTPDRKKPTPNERK